MGSIKFDDEQIQFITKVLAADSSFQNVLQAILQGFQQVGQQGAQQISQQSSAAATLAEMVNKVATSSSRDTDVNAEEAMKSYSPVWGLNAKLLFAHELGAFGTKIKQGEQIIQNAINTANQITTESANSFGRRLLLGDKMTAVAIGQPGYFHEKAPAEQEKNTKD